MDSLRSNLFIQRAPIVLPVDSHELAALCTPRPVFIGSGSRKVEGGRVDAKGMFLEAVGAGPVYRLLGKKDLGTTEFPPMETYLSKGDRFSSAEWRPHYWAELVRISRLR
jgi:hypothetical protein